MSFPTARLLAVACVIVPMLAADAQAGTVSVSNTESLARAIQRAEPGDDIVLDDGTYTITRKITATGQGTAQQPITVRAANRLKAVIQSTTMVAFEVNGENWIFRDLDIKGTCNDDATCEHAFHVTGGATGFQLRNNRIADFNAHLKVNAIGRTIPSGGLVEGNELFNTHARQTNSSVAVLNIDHGTDWVVRGNLIYDFRNAGGNGVSYGAYVKGGAERPIFERNLVICRRFDQESGSRIGLSFGGGGIGPVYCAPAFDANVPCEREVIGGIMRNNIIANCPDVGIYLNAASDSAILFNTLIRTRGIDFRFAGSTGEARGNLMASEIRTRDRGTFKDGGNMTRMLSGDLEAMYRDPDLGDLRIKGSVAQIAGKGGKDPRVTDDFCGRRRTPPFDAGALQSSAGDCPTLR